MSIYFLGFNIFKCLLKNNSKQILKNILAENIFI